MLIELPEELLLHILRYLAHPRSLDTFVRLRRVNKLFYRIYGEKELLINVLEQISVLQTSQVKMEEIGIWYQKNKPLCEGCGVPSAQVFKFAGSFVMPTSQFLCSSCRSWRNSISSYVPSEKPKVKN